MSDATNRPGLREEFERWYKAESESRDEIPRFREDHFVAEAWDGFIDGAREIVFFTVNGDGELEDVAVPPHLLVLRDMGIV